MKRCGIPMELWGEAMNNATFPQRHITVVPARPGSARSGHRPLTVPPQGPHCSPCSGPGRIPSQRLRGLAGQGGCRGPGCPVRRSRYVGSSLPSPVLLCIAERLTPALGSRAAGPRWPSMFISVNGPPSWRNASTGTMDGPAGTH